MSDLISRQAMIDEIQLIEKDLLKDKNDAENSGDEEMIFAINNQLNALWRAKSKARGIPTAYDVDKVVEQLEDYGKYKGILMDNGETLDNYLPVLKCKQLVKGGGQG